ncbi:hypothetical protein JKP88DRAFT_203390 [Tribonema minus]|uniref:fructose-bisphosphate aldolase n=1 Tax=Tribonema minus TaxID=303371 RepID=A0A835YJL7_9STRA|nr:hypothetical protein JKP88DRAFT_203390 [Tribonema minus]
MEAAAALNSPIIIQVSNGGAAFFAGKSVKNDAAHQQASIAGSIAMALHVRALAKLYGVPVVLHSDHCGRALLRWFEGMLAADAEHFEENGEPLFSSHMLDLSEESDEENIATCKKYLQRMAPMKLWLEVEIGITGGEEDGVDNSDAGPDKLYTQPAQIYAMHRALSPVSDRFSIAAAFGNVHGVYSPGNVKLDPGRLARHQGFVRAQIGGNEDKPCYFVFHGGSGSSPEEIRTAIQAGVVKMNVDTDTQWAYWQGVLDFYKENEGYLQGQIGNPEGADRPNKKLYDPRAWLCAAETALAARVRRACEDLGNVNTLALEAA